MDNRGKTLLDIKQTVEKFKVDGQKTFTDYMLRLLERQGKIPSVRLGAKIYFIYEDLLDWLEEQSQANIKQEQEPEPEQLYGVLRRVGR